MPSQIRPTRLEVSDRFPMLGFTIKTDGNSKRYEVAIASDPGLFQSDARAKRTKGTFYSSRGAGFQPIERGEAVYVVPPEVLARFAGQEKVYFALATYANGKGGPEIAGVPTQASPYVSLKSLSGRSLRRVRVLPSRQRQMSSYQNGVGSDLEWGGDAATPGTQPAVAAAPANGSAKPADPAAAAAHAAAFQYNDGFGPLPGKTAPAAVPVATPAAQGLAPRRARGLDYSDDPEAHGIEGPAYTEDATLPTAQARALSVPTPDYPHAARFVPSPAFNTGRAGQTVDRIVIHITDAPTTSSTVNHFTAPGAQASAHYLVGQDGEVVQFVSEAGTAWHARGVNSRSVGIEHVAIKRGGVDYPRSNGTMQHFDYLPPTDTQYCESAALVAYLCDKYGLSPNRTTIIGHREADPKTGHTSCPDGAWNWDHFMDLVTNRYCAAQPVVGTAEGQSMSAPKSGLYKPVSRAMVVGLEDRQKARKYGRSFRELFQWRVPTSVVRAIEARGFKVQTIDAAVGDLNLDRYPVAITQFPSGWDAPSLLQHFIRNINEFIDTDLTVFTPYDDSDAQKLASSNPKGTVFKLDLFGPDNAAVVISAAEPQFYIVSTINTPWGGDHPVSGHRQFGYIAEEGKMTFYTRGADRATLGFPGTETLTFLGGEQLWKSFQRKLAAFINDNGGAAEILEPFSERFNATAMREEFGHYDVAQSLATARAMSTGTFTVNWDEVELIPQPTDFSCWAAAGAMLVGWRDRVSLTPDTVAQACSRSTASGLLTDDNARFAAEMGFVAVPPVCYTEEGFRTLLENNGPLWVSEGVPPNLHAIIVTGMFSDASNTYVRIADPWDRAVGTPGKPGAYASTHATGSRYIMSWDEFTRQYEAALTGDPPNRQILHSGNPNGLTPNTGATTPPPGYAMSAATEQFKRRPSRALAYESFSVNWDDVESIAQPTDATCWAASGAMVVGWRDRVSLDPEALAKICGRSTVSGLDPNQRRQFASEIGLAFEEPGSYSVDGFRNLLESYGPLWVSVQLPGSGHAIVVTGMYSHGADDGSDTYVRISDPWDRVVGKPGSPGSYLNTYSTGSRYILSWADFTKEYEARASTSPDGTVNAQILHAATNGGRTPNRTGAAGYAMSLTLPERFDHYKSQRKSYAPGRALEVDVPIGKKQPAQLPKASKVGWAKAALINAGLAILSPELPRIRDVANELGICMAIGPAVGAAFAAGGGASAGVLFAPDGDIGVYGSFDVRAGFDFGASAGMQVTMVRGGIDEFNEVNYAFAVGWEEVVDATVMVLFNNESFRGVTFELGVGISLEPLKIFVAIEKSVARTVATAKSLGNGVLYLAPPPKPKAKAMAAPVAAAIATKIGEVVIEKVLGYDGSITWSLDQMRGLKHPNDKAPDPSAPFTDAKTIRLNDWPYVEAVDTDQISAWFSVDWQYNGKSLGNVAISNIGTNGALLRKLSVDARIMDDNIVYPTSSPTYAALKVRFYYRFSRAIGADEIATLDLHLYGDGTYEQSGRWEQY